MSEIHERVPIVSPVETESASAQTQGFYRVEWSPLEAVGGVRAINNRLGRLLAPLLGVGLSIDYGIVPLVLEEAVREGEVRIHIGSLVRYNEHLISGFPWYRQLEETTYYKAKRGYGRQGLRLEVIQIGEKAPYPLYTLAKLDPDEVFRGQGERRGLNIITTNEWIMMTPERVAVAIADAAGYLDFSGINFKVRVPGTGMTAEKGAQIKIKTEEILNQNPNWLANSLTFWLQLLGEKGTHLEIWKPRQENPQQGVKIFGAKLVDTSVLELLGKV